MANKTERVEARFPADLKALAERAASASGYTLTDYLASLVRSDAPKRLKEQNEMQGQTQTTTAKCQEQQLNTTIETWDP